MEWQLRHEEAFQRDGQGAQGEAMKRTGCFPKEWENPVYPERHLMWLWEIFTELDTTRNNGFSVGRISVNELNRYCNDEDFTEDERYFIKRVILKMDSKYTALSAKMAEEKQPKDKKDGKKHKKFGS